MFELVFQVSVLFLVQLALWIATISIWFVILSYFVFVWLRARRMKEAGLCKYRVREFASRFYNERAQQAVATRLDDYALFCAYALPDHTAQAKQVISREILRRGYTSEQFVTWAPPGEALTVPPPFRTPPRLGHLPPAGESEGGAISFLPGTGCGRHPAGLHRSRAVPRR